MTEDLEYTEDQTSTWYSKESVEDLIKVAIADVGDLQRERIKEAAEGLVSIVLAKIETTH